MTYLIGHIDPEHAFGVTKENNIDKEVIVEYIQNICIVRSV